MAINRAKPQYRMYESVQIFSKIKDSSEYCIFISHKSSDLEAARKIGDYIINNAKIDIYLDDNDKGLVDAVSREDDKMIVKYIEKALNRSTHLLCLISDQTRTSWWVPYEIGIAKAGSKNIASLKLKNITGVPSFLKIETVLMGIKSLNEYLEKINKSGVERKYSSLIPYYNIVHPLDECLDISF
jgi:hypothetical protein